MLVKQLACLQKVNKQKGETTHTNAAAARIDTAGDAFASIRRSSRATSKAGKACMAVFNSRKNPVWISKDL